MLCPSFYFAGSDHAALHPESPPTPIPGSLFRTMGLRHMFVSPPHPRVSGMITRKDIITGEHLSSISGLLLPPFLSL